MAACEKCWEDARRIHFRQPRRGEELYDVYKRLLDERKDNPCTPREQAGQFWDEEKQIDKRLIQ